MFPFWLIQLSGCEDLTPASVPHPPRAGPVLLRLLFFPLVPSSYQILYGSIYSFLVVGYSCLLSAGILQTLLYLKVYSWLSMERDVFHVHLHLHHLVLITSLFFISVSLFLFFYTFILSFFSWHSFSLRLGFPGGSDSKETACNAGDPGPGEGNGCPLQYSCLENHMDRGARWATSTGLQSWTRLNN